MNKIIFMILLATGLSTAQEQAGYVHFDGDETWVIKIHDSLSVQSDEYINLPVGSYSFIARPQISYTWPAILVSGEFSIKLSDTLNYALRIEESTLPDSITKYQPKLTQYANSNYHPSIKKHAELKTGLIISALLANWASFYLKREADDYYRDYQRASDLSKLNILYDKSQQFDSYASIMLGISATALSAYIYLTLTQMYDE